MLARPHRLQTAEQFRSTVRRGRRAGTPRLVVYVDEGSDPVRLGLIVAKSVGPAVVRNHVKRRLRHVMTNHLEQMASGSVVIRALPGAAEASYQELSADIDACLGRTVRQQRGSA